MSKKTIGIWFGVNRNGFLYMSSEKPTKNEKAGKWESQMPFCASAIYSQIKQLADKIDMSWNSDLEYMEINVK